MKLRPVLLVLLLLSGFYYVTTHVAVSHGASGWTHGLFETVSGVGVRPLARWN